MNYVTIKRYGTIAEAELARSRLEAQGIPSIVMKEGVPEVTGQLQGAALIVEDKHEVAARMALGI